MTAWRLTRDGAMCQAIVMDGEEGFRLVVVEDQQIVAWECVRSVHELRRKVTATRKARCAAGWLAAPPADRVVQRKRSVPDAATAACRLPTF
ncbi:MAG: hypothetical protein ABIQ52_16720 [Vicinamibacterales bacterium]